MRKIMVTILGVTALFVTLFLPTTSAFANKIEPSWTTPARIPTRLVGFESEVVDGKIYAIGSLDSSFDSDGKKVLVYDYSTDTWRNLANMPTPRIDIRTEVINGKIYTIGGFKKGYTNTTEVYDPSTDMWETLANMQTTWGLFQTEVINGKIYAIGGWDIKYDWDNKYVDDDTEVYDPSTNAWKILEHMPTIRGDFQTEAVDGKIYAIGGWNLGEKFNRNILSSTEVYDTSTNKWTKLAPMPTARWNFQTEVVDGKIYAIGGITKDSRTSANEVYDPLTNSWNVLAPMSIARDGFHTEVIDGKIYAIGGMDTPSMETYTVNKGATK